MKQETPEEAVKRICSNQDINYSGRTVDITTLDFEILTLKSIIQDMDATIKSKYSEEEVKHIVSEALQSALVKFDLEQWFKQFKNK